MTRHLEFRGWKFEMKSTDGKLWCSSITDCLHARRRQAKIDQWCKAKPHEHKALNVLDHYMYGGEW